MEKHYAGILDAEKITAEPAAVGLVARAADGSVRDGLSILDQAIALAGGGAITEGAVRDMLGIADKGLVFDLLEQVMRGDAAAALGGLAALYDGGADPVLVVQEILDLVHFLMRLKLTPAAGRGRSGAGRRPRPGRAAGGEALGARAGARLADAAEGAWRRRRPRPRPCRRWRWCWCGSPMSRICRRRRRS